MPSEQASSGSAASLRDDQVVRRKAIYEWAQGDATLLSARCIKAEDALEQARRLLLDVEGCLLGYWTDLPQAEIQRLLPKLRETLGDWEPRV